MSNIEIGSFVIEGLEDITEGLHSSYQGQVEAAGPALGVLIIKARILRKSHPIIKSPVDARLIEASFGTWINIKSHLKSIEEQGIQALGSHKFQKWTKEIQRKSADEHMLLAWTILSFVESHMRSSSEDNRPVLLNLLNSIVEYNEEHISTAFSSNSLGEANAEIVLPLIAGKSAFTLVCHSKETMDDWSSELDAATVLLIPQVILSFLNMQMRQTRERFRSSLEEEVNTWNSRPSSVNEFIDWKWLPDFGI